MSDKNIKIAFTSCARIEAFPVQTQWRELQAMEPDHLVLLGDNIYMDYWPYTKKNDPSHISNMSSSKFSKLMDNKYKAQWSEPHFANLIDYVKNQKGGIVCGTWDDHDFAWDNAIGTQISNDKKDISTKLFNKWFYGEQSTKSIYRYFDLQNARMIVLDHCRYAQNPSSSGQLIGTDQMEFLKGALDHTKAYTLICASKALTLFPTILGKFRNPLAKTTRWKDYDREYKKVCELLNGRDNVIYLGGDLHANLFATPNDDRPCYELISSGMAVDKYASQNSLWKSISKRLGSLLEPSSFYDATSNWGLLELSAKHVNVTFSSKVGKRKRRMVSYPLNE